MSFWTTATKVSRESYRHISSYGGVRETLNSGAEDQKRGRCNETKSAARWFVQKQEATRGAIGRQVFSYCEGNSDAVATRSFPNKKHKEVYRVRLQQRR